MRKNKRTTKPAIAKANIAPHDKLPLIEHIHELRRRLVYVAVCVVVGSAVAYGLEQKLIAFLLKPSHGQHFIYTSPMGGVNFLFGVCLDLGLVVATPIIIYQLLAFLQPLMKDTTRRFLLLASAAAGFVAVCGVLFGYFIGLPSALHFLLHQFTNVQVRPLITIQAYVQFVALYLFGSALMFQLPLILLCINRIKPLKPSGLFRYERHLITGAFIVAFIMNPTPNVIDQLLVVLPIIITYQFGIALIWLINRGKNPTHIYSLREQDMQRQAERASRPLVPLRAPLPLQTTSADITPAPNSEPVPEMVEQPAAIVARPNQYATATQRRRYVQLRGQLVQ